MSLTRKGKGIGLALELVPAALFNFAVAFAVATLLRNQGVGEQAAAASVAAGVAAFLFAWRALHRLDRDERYAIPSFAAPPLETVEDGCEEAEGELLLVDPWVPPESAQVLHLMPPPCPAPAAAEQQDADELLLDDIVANVGPESRVIRLFDPAAMPTAGELSERIERHLRSGRAPSSPPDATGELHDALAELRRSLR